MRSLDTAASADLYNNIIYKLAQIIFNINHLNAELNPICHLLALLGAHHILHVNRVRVTFANPLYLISEDEGTLWMEFFCEVFLEVWKVLCVLYFCTKCVCICPPPPWFIFVIIWYFSGVKLLYGKDTPVYNTALMGNEGSTYDDSLFDRHARTNWDDVSGLASAWGGGHCDYTVTELLGCGPCGLLDPAAPIFGIEHPQLRAANVYLVCR